MDVVSPVVRRWCNEAEQDFEGFWARAALELPWFSSFEEVLIEQPPSFRWFAGGTTNLCYNAVDRHVQRGNGGRAAIIYENELGERRVLSYAMLLADVKQIAAALRAEGVGVGDRVAIYMPTGVEAIETMLAITRIGAIHLVVFAGFGSGALAERVRLAGARLLVCADATWRKGKVVPLWSIVEEALADPSSPVERVVVLKRQGRPALLRAGRDIEWGAFLEAGSGAATGHVALESNEPAFILATSGTTATPKLAVHTHGPYQVGVHSAGRWCFALRPEDVWWSTSDIGWIVGHSYIVYGPLLAGATTIVYEGAIDHPGAGHVYEILERYQVTGLFTAPTAVRLLMRYGLEPLRGIDLSSVKRVFCAGEVLNPPAWQWLQRDVFHDEVPVIDHMWQTETAAPVFGNPYGVGLLPIKPGSASIALAGHPAEVRNVDGTRCAPGEKGIVVLTRPFPGLTPAIWNDPERYARDYWGQMEGVYVTGDAGSVDDDGYFFFAGRADEIIKIAGHRIGTIEVETAFLRHEAVAESGVIGRPDELRGEVISVFVVLRPGYEASDELREQLLAVVRADLGPVAVIGELNFVAALPKTRSGKIMRRVLRAVSLGVDPGDISTIEDEGSVQDARAAWAAMRGGGTPTV
jgi:acetyl-CoA synthetase